MATKTLVSPIAGAALLSLLLCGCGPSASDADARVVTTPPDAGERIDAEAESIDAGEEADAATETATLSGTVFDGESEQPVEGATVEIEGAEPAIETSTDASGNFSLEVPAETPVAILASDEGFMEARYYRVIPSSGESDLDVTISSSEFTDQVAASAGIQARESDDGMMIIDFVTPSDSGGESAGIDLEYQGVYTFDETSAPVRSSELESGGLPLLVFHSVTPGEAAVTVTESVGSLSCERSHPDVGDVPVYAGSYSFVEVTCSE